MEDPDIRFMRRALALAERGRGRTSPNPLVGAVVVAGGRAVGEGFHARAGGPHAEVVALDQAGPLARGGTLYVTLEPCCHYGRTPPCTERIIASGVVRVVAALVDPNPRVNGAGFAALRRAGIEVRCGVLGEPARRQNEAYLKFITTGRPWVILKYAMSADGKLATRTGDSQWITGLKARHLVHRLRNAVDAVAVGVDTVLADDPLLTTRLPRGGRDAVAVVLDSQARTPPTSALLRGSRGAPVVVAVTAAAPAARVERLRSAGAEVEVLPEGPGGVSWSHLLDRLGARGLTSLLVEGGARVAGSLVDAGLVDKLMVFMAPLVIGGSEAPGPVAGQGAETLSEALRLERVRFRRLGTDILLEGYAGGRGQCSAE